MRFVSVLMVFRAHRARFALHARVHAKTSKNKAVGRPKPSPECHETLKNRRFLRENKTIVAPIDMKICLSTIVSRAEQHGDVRVGPTPPKS